MTSVWGRALRVGAAILACAASLAIARAILHEPGFHWDFFLYYHAAKAHAQGLNPYDVHTVSSVAGVPVQLPFVYPPPSLYFYRLFLVFEYPVALQVYFWTKIGVLLLLLELWRRKFAGGIGVAWFYPFALLAFNATIYADLRSGNFALFEQALLWIGFAGFVERRYALFCVGVLLAAMVKLQPLALLGLLLFADENGDKRRYVYLSVSVLVVVVLAVAWRCLDPELSRAYVHNLFHSNVDFVLRERGRINPSTFTTISSALAFARESWPELAPEGIEWVLFATAVVFVSIVSWRALRRARDREADGARFTVELACTAYALVSLRFKDYTYMLLIAPAFWIVHRTTPKPWLRGLLLALFMVGGLVPPPRSWRIASHVWEYSPLFLAWMTWFSYLRESRRGDASASEPPRSA